MSKLGRTDMALIPCILFLFVIHRANSISCFQCNSYMDEGCADLKQANTLSDYLLPCEENDIDRLAFCRKMYLKIKMETAAGGIHERVIRSCGWTRNKDNKECYRREDADHSEIVCQCFGDACNRSARSLAYPVAALICIILFWLK